MNHGFGLAQLDNKLDESMLLEPLSKELQSELESEKLHLVNYKIIGHFPQGDSAIYADYEELMKRALAGELDQGIIDNLLEIPSPDENWEESEYGEQGDDDVNLDEIPTKDLNLILESDASQDAVIVAADSTDCIVVRGPPGTGKSQAIVNLISNALANRKKILIVCQKRAALDVVYHRLNKVGLSSYVSLLHDATNDRAELYKQLSKLINYSQTSAVSTGSVDGSSDSVEWKISKTAESVDNLISEQRKILSALSKKYFGGISIRELYLHSQSSYIPKLNLSDVAAKLKHHELDDLTNLISRMEISCKKFDNPIHPWYNRNSFADFSFDDKHRIFSIINDITRTGDLGKMIVLPDKSQQKQLVESLQTLSSTTGMFRGMFRKLKSSVKEANETARRLVNEPGFLSGQSSILDPLLKEANHGLEFWNNIEKMKDFMNETGFSSFTRRVSIG